MNVAKMCAWYGGERRELLKLDALEIELKKTEAYNKRLNESKTNLEMELYDINDAPITDRDNCARLWESFSFVNYFRFHDIARSESIPSDKAHCSLSLSVYL